MITIFTTCRSFEHPHFGVVQRNAITSWLRAINDVEVLVMGDSPGAKGFCEEMGIQFIPDIPTRQSGVPLLNEMMKLADKIAKYDDILHISSDMVLLDQNSVLVAKILRQTLGEYLAGAVRYQASINEPIDFSGDWREWVLHQGIKPDNPVCGDYFLASRGFYGNDMPPFAVGRGFADFWIHLNALRKGKLVDVTKLVTVIHQAHGHPHVGGTLSMKDNEDFLVNKFLCGGVGNYIIHTYLYLDSDGQLKVRNPEEEVKKWEKQLNMTFHSYHTTTLRENFKGE